MGSSAARVTSLRPSVALVRRVARVEAVGRQRPIRRRSRFGRKPRFEAATCSFGVFGGPVGGYGCQWRGLTGRWPLEGAAMAARWAGVSISAPPPRAPQATRGDPPHTNLRSMSDGERLVKVELSFGQIHRWDRSGPIVETEISTLSTAS